MALVVAGIQPVQISGGGRKIGLSETMAKVILENVSKRFGALEVVPRLNLHIEDKEFLVLLGPSGCGKSTTLRMIAGLEKASSGDIYIGDTLVNDMAPRDRDIAMVFQDYALYPHKTVFQNMAFGLMLRKYPREEIVQRVKASSEILGIQELMDRKPKELSGGQRQRVALGRAIVRQPAVFLFDEPLSNLDAKLRGHMRAELTKLHRKLNTTIIYVTHDQVEAMTMGTKIVIMDKGVIQQAGSPTEIYREPKNSFVGQFIGNPGINFVPARIVGSDDEIFVEADAFRLRLPDIYRRTLDGCSDREVIFGIRPEDIEDAVYADAAYALQHLHGIVNVVEMLGAEVQLEVSCGTNTLIARVDARTSATPEQPIDLAINLDRLHLFEKEAPHRRIVAG